MQSLADLTTRVCNDYVGLHYANVSSFKAIPEWRKPFPSSMPHGAASNEPISTMANSVVHANELVVLCEKTIGMVRADPTPVAAGKEP